MLWKPRSVGGVGVIEQNMYEAKQLPGGVAGKLFLCPYAVSVLALHTNPSLMKLFREELLHGASGAAGRSARARASAAGSACTAGGAGRSA